MGTAPPCNADLATDPLHCGACGHDCLGGSCEQGVCTTGHFTFASGPTTLASREDVVYFTEYFGFNVRGLSIDQGSAKTLAHFDEWHRPIGVALAGQHAYFTVYNPLDPAEEGPGWLGRAPLDGGPPSVVVSSPSGPWAVAIDAEAVYFTNRWGGSALSRVALDAPDGATAEELIADRGWGSQPISLALDETHAYVGSYGSGTVERVPKTGGPVETLLSGQLDLVPIFVDGPSLLWSTRDGIWSAPKDDLSSATLLSATIASAFAALGEYVYFVGPTTFGRLRRDGSGEQLLLGGLRFGSGIAVADGAVYFGDQAGGTIGRFVP